MSDGAEQDAQSDSGVSGDAGKASVPFCDGKPQTEVGPGQLAVSLSHVNEHLRDLDSDPTLPRRERDNVRLFYTRERNKFQLQLAVLYKKEKVQFSESKFEETRKALEFARSEGGRQDARRTWQTRLAGSALGGETKTLSQIPENPEQDEIRKFENQRGQAEASLNIARSELQAAASALERFCAEDSKWEEWKPAARRWELGRKWEAITPDELRPAVIAIHNNFESLCWQAARSTKKLCSAALYPTPAKDAASPNPENLDPYKRFLSWLLGRNVQESLLGSNGPAPVIFKSYLDVLETTLKTVVRTEFGELFEIAKAQADMLNMHPIEWTKRHLDILISTQKWSARTWVTQVCDGPRVFRARSSREEIFLEHWRAPRFIHMRPAGNSPYDSANAWDREELAVSLELLEALSDHLPMVLRFELDRIADAAHIEFVKRYSVRPKAVSQRAENRNGAHAIPSAPPVMGAQSADVRRGLHERFRAPSSLDSAHAPNQPGNPSVEDALRREVIIRKVQNPQSHRVVSTPDAALYFEVKLRTIHRWTAEHKLRSGGRRGSITIESIRAWETKRSRKRSTQ